MPVVGQVAYLEPFELIDPAGQLITGKTTGDWTKTLFKDGAKQGSPPTITVAEVSGAGGTYAPSFTPVSAGEYRLALQITVSGKVYRFSESFTVLPAAADPAALATAIAGLQSTANAISVNVDAPVSSRASAAVWTSARAAKVDQIGSAAAIVSAGSLQDGGRLELRRGNSYLAANGNAKTWAYTGPSIASGTLTLRTFAGVTVLQVPVIASESTVSADLTAVQTAALALGTPIYRYEIEATLSGGGTSTLVSGDVWVAD